MIKFLLDQGLPRSAASLLRAVGWEIVHVGEIGLSKAPDDQILHFARREDRVCVTLDADFHAILAATGDRAPSVIRIRRQGLRARELVELIRSVVAQVTVDLENEAAVSGTQRSVRVRKLPINRK